MLAKRCIYLLQIEASFLVSLIDGTNLVYCLHDLSEGKLTFLTKYSAGLKLACFVIILIFIFAFTQLSLIRAGRAVGRLAGDAHTMKTSLDFVIWNNLSDSVEILLLYFGIEKFMTGISPRMLISDTLKMLHYFVEFTYELNYVTSSRPKSFLFTVRTMAIVIGLMSFQQLIRFGIMMGKFFAFDYYSTIQLSACQVKHAGSYANPFICLFWYEYLL